MKFFSHNLEFGVCSADRSSKYMTLIATRLAVLRFIAYEACPATLLG
jgi:hypothetical protein